MKEKFKKTIAYILWQFQDPYYQGSAPQIAFFLFLSIFPLLILASQILGVFSLTLEDIQSWANININGEGTEAIEDFITYNPSIGGNIFLILLAFWGGSRVHFSLARITNYTYTDGQVTGRGWFFDRIRAIIAMAIIIVTLLITVVILVYLPNVISALFGNIAEVAFLQSIWVKLRWIIVLGLYFFTISYIFMALPQKRLKYKEILPGTTFTSIGLVVITYIYNFYVSKVSTNNIFYGSLSTIAVFMFWLWCVAWVITLGISVNRISWAIRDENRIPIDSRLDDRRVPFSIGKMRNWVAKYTK